jgi:hypothetical protein
MTAGVWDQVRDAIAAKLAASSGCATAGLRRATVNVDDPLSMTPEVRVLNPAFTMLSQSGSSEEYILEVPFELVVERPAGTKRSNPIAADIARAIQVEMQTGVKLGAVAVSGTSIVDARLLSLTPGLSEYDMADANGNPLYDGYRGVVSVQVFEVVTRTV